MGNKATKGRQRLEKQLRQRADPQRMVGSEDYLVSSLRETQPSTAVVTATGSH